MAAPEEPQPPQPGVTPILGSQLQSTFAREAVSTSRDRTGMGCKGRVVLDCTRRTMGCFAEEPKAGKGKDLDDPWRKKWGKTEG